MSSSAEFDKYAKNYDTLHRQSIKASGYEPDFFDRYKVEEVARQTFYNKRINDILHILNFGCGIGKSEPLLAEYFPNALITGIDVSGESVAEAKSRNNNHSRIDFDVYDGENIVLNKKYDLIFIANVFHHIPHNQHIGLLQQLRKHLHKDGSLIMFEHNPLNPLTLHAVNTCEFDADAVLLKPWYAKDIMRKAGFGSVTLRFTLFFPAMLASLRKFEHFLYSVPMGAQYYVIAQS